MSTYLEISSAGAYASIQDLGRFGYRRIGVPWSGVLSPRLMRIANRLAGNDDLHPVIECFDGGQQLRAGETPVRVAVAGDASLEISSEDGPRQVAAWRSFVLQQGETLRISRIAPGRIAVVALAGLDLPRMLGSASTYARAALGGDRGRALAAGDRLPAAACTGGAERTLTSPPDPERTPIRLVAGPQHQHFIDEAWTTLLGAEYRISAAADRMGIRLEGPALTHAPQFGHEIISDATVPGAIQVPGNGQPIVLLADAQTAGGYPKIATVISADLPRLAALRPGETVRFAAVSAAEGERLARLAESHTRALLDAVRDIPGTGIDIAALYSNNLVGGAISALAEEYRPLATSFTG
ncbi:MAG: biotin-dependent carboxyltransferase family protein [Rhodocyclales bacterium]|nr:biotin-dependent carboxyltransferase family protein [Rhodocyclales bacterium]